ncbi:relaxase/mobilization nuclease domain-containing protein [Rhizosphaericola mali]|uniref:Relaxase/mobilization nuclease domain-containing protein n=1 Tax=Rhizosphaericola mali TaxID=2545455 RepID=A0A5P2GBN3_9BACT|nr:relaxase/mobilization nuclease domain-containing protein [Rhizosphaericola mali]QES91060.1 relaxase/mobilization nuclease domain-containing protein [Rhizosphaericola mali]
MPIVESNSGNGFKGAISYSMQLEKLAELDQEELPVFIECNGVYGSYAAMAHQMRWVAETQDFKRPVLHFRVNFSPSESAHLPKEIQVAAVKSILRGLGIDANRQYIISQHNDKEHTHYHIIANKVDLDGEKMDLTNFNYRATAQADRVERAMDLELTPNRTIFYSADNATGFRYATAEEKAAMYLGGNLRPDRREGVQEIKQYLSATIQNVLLDKGVVSSASFEKALNNRGIEVRFMKNVDGISGVSFNKDGVSVRGTHLGLRWSKIAKSLEANQKLQDAVMEKRAHLRFSVFEEVKKEVGLQLLKSDKITSFSANLSAHGIDYEEGKGFRYECKEGNEQSLLGSHVLFRLAEMRLSDDAIEDQLADNLSQTRLEAQRKANELARAQNQERFNRAVGAWKNNPNSYESLLKSISAGSNIKEITTKMRSEKLRFVFDVDLSGKLELMQYYRKSSYSDFKLDSRFDLRELGMTLDFNQSEYDKLNEVSFEMYNKNLQNQMDMYGIVDRYTKNVVDKLSLNKEAFVEDFEQNSRSNFLELAQLSLISDLYKKEGFSVEEDVVSRDGWEYTGHISKYQDVLNELAELVRIFYEKIKKWTALQRTPEKEVKWYKLGSAKHDIIRENFVLQSKKDGSKLPEVSEIKTTIEAKMKNLPQPRALFASESAYEKWKLNQAIKVSSVKVDVGFNQKVGKEINRMAAEKKLVKKVEHKKWKELGRKM